MSDLNAKPAQSLKHLNKGDHKQNQESSMNEAKRLMQLGRIREATKLIEIQLATVPEDINALYMLAVCQRYLREPTTAIGTLDRLLKLDKRFARAWQEQGHLLKLSGDITAAIMRYGRAVELNPALVASWAALADLYSSDGDRTRAREAHNRAKELRALPDELLSVTSMMHTGEAKKAEALCRHFLQDNPRDVEAMRLLAELATRAGILDDAEFLLESALEFQPLHLSTRFDYVNILLRRQKFAKAFDEAAILVSHDPVNVSFSMLQANACMGIGRFEEAIALCQHALSERPDSPMIHMILGHALKTIGKADEAITAYRHAYTLRPDFGDAYWSLANLKTYRFTREEIESMERILKSEVAAVEDRYQVCFALGKARETVADYKNAFARYEEGNELKRGTLIYDPSRSEKRLRLQKETFTPDFVSSRSESGFPDPAPIFIVGLPRAGSTLLEQILASHSLVDGTLELSNIPAIAQRLNGRMNVNDEPRYPRIIAEKTAEELYKLGQTYIEETSIQRGNARFFIDKMPNNFAHLGLICLSLPKAKIIDARRDPMACGFSCFQQLFAEGQDFSYRLEEIARYYNSYVDLMAHWDRVFPGRILLVEHEDVVADLETAVTRILAFCDLPFQEDCLAFHKTERSVRTASSEQVRQPIYRSGLDRWKNYADYLAPLRKALDIPTHKYESSLSDSPE